MGIKEICAAVLKFQPDAVVATVKEELAGGTDISVILNDGLIAALDEVGRRFSSGDLFLPEMLMAARAMQGGVDVLRPHMVGEQLADKGKVLIGTVKGDQHDIGKNLVAMMLEGAGFTVIDLGVDVAADKFVEAARKNGSGLVAMSALLTTTMPEMETTVQALKQAELQLKIMLGGAPVTRGFSQRIGADGYGEDAAKAVEVARELLQAHR